MTVSINPPQSSWVTQRAAAWATHLSDPDHPERMVRSSPLSLPTTGVEIQLPSAGFASSAACGGGSLRGRFSPSWLAYVTALTGATLVGPSSLSYMLGVGHSVWPATITVSSQSEFDPANRMAPAVSWSLGRQEAELSSLPVDWDGYGANPIDAEAVAAFFSELRTLLAGYDGRPPDVVPGSDGSLQAEWRLPDIGVFYAMEEDGSRFFFQRVAGEDHEATGTVAAEELRRSLFRFFHGGDSEQCQPYNPTILQHGSMTSPLMEVID